MGQVPCRERGVRESDVDVGSVFNGNSRYISVKIMPVIRIVVSEDGWMDARMNDGCAS